MNSKESITLPRVAHAGGGFKGITYTDSLDALNANLNDYEVFELDFNFTSDGHLVCIHDWGESAERTFGKRFDVAPSLLQFEQLVSHNEKFKNCTFEQVGVWLSANPRKFVVTDVKDDNLRALAYMLKSYPDAKTRVIPQIYLPGEYSKVKNLGYERVILTIYRWNPSAIRLLITSQYLDLYAITMPIDRIWLAKLLQELKVPVYIHTINNKETYNILKANGVVNIYTDWLSEKIK
jgi:glycerophosphoryl diester phosphodiesterase